jgi:IclR family acetate operon transcriptional repressor
VDDEEEEIGIRCVGAAVLGVSGKVEAAISVSGTDEQIRSEDIPRFGTMLQEVSFEMSQRLGWTAGPGVAEVSAAVHAGR